MLTSPYKFRYNSNGGAIMQQNQLSGQATPQVNKWKRIVSVTALLALLTILLFFIRAYINGQFRSVESLRAYINGFGILGPLILVVFQALQVVFPILPGMVGCAAGALLFGSFGGFWYNYLGICAGSLIAFYLARRYGSGLVKNMFPNDKYSKWSDWLGKSRFFTLLLFACILLPLAPDDFLCYFSGLTTMASKKFVWIILLGKPWIILAYSLVFSGALVL